MENKTAYVFDNRYNEDLSELIYELIEYEDMEKEDIIGLKIDKAYLEPVIKNGLDVEWLCQFIGEAFDYRMDEENTILDKIEEVLKKHINFESLNEELKTVQLFYPEELYTITEEDYLKAVE